MRMWVKKIVVGLAALIPSSARAEGDYPTGDRMTMWDDPYIVGSYRHFGEIYPSRPVPAADESSELPWGLKITGFEYNLRGTPRTMDEYFKRARTTGLIVLKDGKIVYEHYGFGADEQALLTSQSVAKSITSTLVGFAIGDGLIRSVDDPISDYLPELKGSGYEGVPIKAVLQMSSGVDYTEDYDTGSMSDSERMWNEALIFNKKPLTDFVRNIKRSREPFKRFNYAGIESQALGWLVSRVTGKTLSDYLSEKMWKPLGMEANANWATDGRGPDANETGFCCINATLRDYARFGLLMAQDGVWQGRRLLPEGWVAEATRSDMPQVQPGKLYDGYDMGYQYQWWTFPGEDHAFTAEGINGQFIYVNPAQKVVIVVANVWKDWWSEDLEDHTHAIFESFVERLRN
jgi:CubicO group peptidase (beta-lactamase class C family)